MRLIYIELLNSEGSMGDRTAYGESDKVRYKWNVLFRAKLFPFISFT